MPATTRKTPPWVFLFLPVPYGVFLGYMQTPLPWLLRQTGMSVDRIGSFEALLVMPLAIYFLWSPVVDFWLRRRTWTVLLSAMSGLMLGTAVLLLRSYPEAAIWMLFAGFCVNVMTCASAGGLMASSLEGDDKSRAAAWMQGGTLAAQALGGGALLFVSRRMPIGITACVAALLAFLPALVALTIEEPAVESGLRDFKSTCRVMATEIRETLFTWKSLPGILLLISPVGTGAAQGLFPALARDYGVGEHGVLLLNGLLGGVLTMLGAFSAVILPAHWDRRVAYAAAGLAASSTGIYLMIAPLNAFAYFLGVGLYLLTTGACYGFFLGVVVVTMGEAGASASTRYTILVCIGNLPIVYMTKVEAWGYAAFGIRGVPALDAAGNLLVAACVLLWLVSRRMRRREELALS